MAALQSLNLDGKEYNPVSMDLHHQISQHYFLEARMLQNRQYREWLENLVAKDIHYWIPIFENRYSKDKRPEPTPDDPAIYNDNYDELKQRVERLYTGQVWMEDPPSRIRYLITNVEAFQTADNSDEFMVYCNFAIIRHRQLLERTEHVGGREDRLRRTDDGFQLARRKINMDARVTVDKNTYFFA